MQIFRSSGFSLCLSALLLVLGTYLVTVEIPVRITYDPTATEQYDLMRIYLPLGFTIWLLALAILIYGVILGLRRSLAVTQLRKPLPVVSIIVGVALGFLASSSTLLTWVIAERVEPFIETRGGIYDVEQYHALTGIQLMTGVNSVTGDIILLVFVGAFIGILYIPLFILLERGEVAVIIVLLFLLSGVCIIYPVISIYTHENWWISLDVDGALGFLATCKDIGVGFLIATLCASGLIVFGVFIIIKLVHQHTCLTQSSH